MNRKNIKIVYFGTPDIAEHIFRTIHGAGYNIICVVTREDKPKGRGYLLEMSPVKKAANEYRIPVYQPTTLKTAEAYEYLQSLGADMFITCAYGRIFPEEILNIPKLGCFNMHASLLPKLRGASPINRAIINGDTVGGVTVMKMDVGMDTGDMILKKQIEIPFDMDFGTYYDKVTELGGEAMIEFLERDSLDGEKQNESEATHADKIEKQDCQIDFNDTAVNVYNKIRGLCPVPAAFTFLSGKRCKIFKAVLCDEHGEAGKILFADKRGICIACKDKSIVVTELQAEGKSRMTSTAFLAGNKLL